MIRIFRKSDGKEIPTSEYTKIVGQKMVNGDKTPLSELFRMEIDGKEVNPDEVKF